MSVYVVTSEKNGTPGTVPYGSTPKDCCEDLDVSVHEVAGNAPAEDVLP